VKVSVWDGYMGMKRVKSSRGGGCTDCWRGGQRSMLQVT